MVEINQFGSTPPGDPQTCSRCEALLMDVLDGVASGSDQEFFDQHVASCTGCSQMLADAKRGGAWLEMLRDPRPEPPAALFERILAQTSGLTGADQALSGTASSLSTGSIAQAVPSGPSVVNWPVTGAPGVPATYAPRSGGMKVLPFRVRKVAHHLGQTMLQPRLAMTAAMAFFSIALTLNLTGVRVSELRASDLRPANLRRNFYEANARVIRYCDNLRVVYELEARAHDLQRNADSDPQGSSSPAGDNGSSDAPQQPANDPDRPAPQKAAPKPGPGTSRREPLTHDGALVAQYTLSNPELRHFPAHPKGDQA